MVVTDPNGLNEQIEYFDTRVLEDLLSQGNIIVTDKDLLDEEKQKLIQMQQDLELLPYPEGVRNFVLYTEKRERGFHMGIKFLSDNRCLSEFSIKKSQFLPYCYTLERYLDFRDPKIDNIDEEEEVDINDGVLMVDEKVNKALCTIKKYLELYGKKPESS